MSNSKTTEATASAAASGSGYLDFEKPLFRIQIEISELEARQADDGRDFSADIRQLRSRLNQMTKRLYTHLTAWETVMVARHPQRPLSPDYIRMCVRDFCEIHGDRLYGDDKALITGFGRIGPHKAGYTMVMFPVVAVLLSVLFEGLAVESHLVLGIVLVLVGNLAILDARRTARRLLQSMKKAPR